jgi:hypothetical protein
VIVYPVKVEEEGRLQEKVWENILWQQNGTGKKKNFLEGEKEVWGNTQDA